SWAVRDLPHKPTIAAKYAAIVATSRRLSFPACNETDASLTFPSFVEPNVCFYGQTPFIRLNSREKRPNSRPTVSAVGQDQPGSQPRQGRKNPEGRSIVTPCLSPSGAHSWICLVPRLSPWANVLRLSEANTSGA